jgi:putative ABC transport system ATP-binding protein
LRQKKNFKKVQRGMNCFEFRNISFAWPGGRTVLEDQTFTIPDGSFVVVRGPSGSGKSTLLRMMNRLEEPQSGVIRYRGRDLTDYDPPRLRQRVVYFQQMPVVADVTVRETLLMPFRYAVNKRLIPPADDDLAARLDEVNLGMLELGERAGALSVGQRQRLSLARALMTGPEVLLLDEPTASLDSESQVVVEQIAEQRCTDGATVIMVTHDGFSPRSMPMVEIHMQDGKVDICL